ncbi:MAG: 2,3,4,5-tetrahydropyridine-2,6-dicarboxylate N-succinyltransferase [Gammaproteobacteria bacterium]|jgi:2,3,4,5-tetrahydropyridine-2-carboxylate N-succinyltransferase|nr:2,3,4,5-tetrahydropyridine-2,6-dicarboxylate N-succinyltransferase [Gammaproteobacteria bacterium]
MSHVSHLKNLIKQHWRMRQTLTSSNAPAELYTALDAIMDLLEQGKLRVAEPDDQGQWQVHEWLKQAILLYFRVRDNSVVHGAGSYCQDKVPLRFVNPMDLDSESARIVPPAVVRRGAHIGADAVLMPSYLNIGAYVGAGSMIDTWATVGSCAQIGRNVHVSGGAGIGGVLEPLQAAPTIIEDNCFIGARSEVVEGVRVGAGAVIGMGVFIGQSTKIYDRESGAVLHGHIPAGAVVVSGSLPATDGSHALYCAVIVKRVDAKTRAKTSINDLLRSG